MPAAGNARAAARTTGRARKAPESYDASKTSTEYTRELRVKENDDEERRRAWRVVEMGDGGDEKIALLSEETKWSRWVFLWEWEERQRQLLLAAAAQPVATQPPPLAAGDDVLYKLDGRHWRVMKLMRPASTAQYNAARNLLGKLKCRRRAARRRTRRAGAAEVEAPAAEAPPADVPMAGPPAEEAAPAADVDGAMDVDASADATGGNATEIGGGRPLGGVAAGEQHRPTAAAKGARGGRPGAVVGAWLGRRQRPPSDADEQYAGGGRYRRAVRAGAPLRRYSVQLWLDRATLRSSSTRRAPRDAVRQQQPRASTVATVETVRAPTTKPRRCSPRLSASTSRLIAANKEKYKGIKPASG